ncbi:MAG: UvrB/UvrC motif-containing protein [bacterium]|nr:UvrB/UvrC motif-containing protein [bacterium]
MLCQDCKKREAQVHLTQIINNEKIGLSLCKECASARGFHSPLDNMPFPLAEILTNLAKSFTQEGNVAPLDAMVCPTCQLTFEEFTRQGRFGCGDCYRTFRPRLESIMRKIHGASLHRGKAPDLPFEAEQGEVTIPVKEEERLETELRKAIDAEDFERAAEIRDKLKSIKYAIGYHS